MPIVLNDIENQTSAAVAHYWTTLREQSSRQTAGDADRGGRASVTGGKQMDGFAIMVKQMLADNGLPYASVYTDKHLQIPGYFRPTKRWDMLVIHERRLLAAVEFKSQKGPSFSNNFNNRAEEAIGTGHDLCVAYREGAFGRGVAPWLGWLMLLEDCPASRSPVSVDEPHFAVFPEFKGTSYAARYELLLRKLTREKLYDSAAFLLSAGAPDAEGRYTEPAPDLGMRQFLAGLAGHVAAAMASGLGDATVPEPTDN